MTIDEIIIKPVSNKYSLDIPDEWIGKEIRLTGTEIDTSIDNLTKEEKIARIQEITKNSRIDLSNFKFDRDEATNYDE